MNRCRDTPSGLYRLPSAPLQGTAGGGRLTNLYNERPQWLVDVHSNLNTVVAEAYGWQGGIADDSALHKLLELNTQVLTQD